MKRLILFLICVLNCASSFSMEQPQKYNEEATRELFRSLRNPFSAASKVTGITQALARGADPNAVEPESLGGFSPLLLAVARNEPENVKLLLAGGANPNFQAPFTGWTALLDAADRGTIEMIQLLLEAGANANLQNAYDYGSRTALMYALSRSNDEDFAIAMVKLLLDAEADEKMQDSEGQTAVDIARARGYDRVVKLLTDPKPEKML